MTGPHDGDQNHLAPAAEVEVGKRPSQNAVFQAVRRLTITSLSAAQNGEYHSDEDEHDGDSENDRDCKKGVFIDAEAMKEKVRANLALDRRDTTAHFKETGACAYLAKNAHFERVMLGVIAMNAIWIAVDTDHNPAEVLTMASPIFIVAENFFCFAFSVEWIIRFFSFQKKKYMLKDAWFVFDTFMVVMMVLETWVLSLYIILSSSSGGSGMLGNSSILKMARLLRLSRMARMARLLRAMPELMIMVKGMITAVRSVAITLTLLILIMYAFGIAFCQLTKGSDVGTKHFDKVLDSMYTLGIYGTLTDNIKYISDELGKESFLLSGFFFLYVLLTAFTVMNMLIGVLCEVVSAVAATEREEILVAYVKSKVLKVVEEIDQDGDRHITKSEMVGILENASACRALKEVGVDVMSLVDNADAIFVDTKGREMNQLSFADFMSVVLSLRGSNNATVKDVVELRKSLRLMSEDITGKFQPLMKQVQKALQELKHAPKQMDTRSVTSLQSTMLENSTERLDLAGSWCPFAEAKQPEVPDWVMSKHTSEKPGGSRCPQTLVDVEEDPHWRQLPQVVPEPAMEIPDKPPREPMKLLVAMHARPHTMPPAQTNVPFPALGALPVPEVPARRSIFDWRRPDALIPGPRGAGCEDVSGACAGAALNRLKLPALENESWCPVGAVELKGCMAELTKSLTAGLCQVKRMEERILEPLLCRRSTSCHRDAAWEMTSELK